MKLSHVIVLSIIGMIVASLSVLAFTSPRGASSDVDLTSNEMEPSIVASVSTTPRLSLVLEPDAIASSNVPRANPTGQTASSAAYENREAFGSLQLTAVEEPCSFSIDGKPVKIENDVPLMVRTGRHKVTCERPNGDVIETQVDVVEDAINPVFF
jgi:hypothetical protein